LDLAGDIFGNREKIDVKCSACGEAVQVVNPRLATFRQEATKKKVEAITSEIGTDGRALRLPADEEISLRVLEGEEKGTVYPLTKPRMTIGRANADIIVSDQRMSRIHCALEVSEEGVMVLDLSSTNGTFVDERPIKSVALSSGSTFRAGDHLFQLVVSPKET
jgi:hypothetical protein